MFLKNCWYVAAWAHEVTKDEILSRKLLNEDIIFYRCEDGTATAMVDRCPHRLAPLSKGRIENGCVRCMYHGLLFNTKGDCVEVPQQDKIPPNLNVKTFPLVERDNLVWIWMGDPSLADESAVLDAHWLDSPDWAYVPGYIKYDNANFMLIVDNLLDFSHLGFVHETTIGGKGNSGLVKPKVERFDWGLKITRQYTDDDIPPFIRGIAKFEGKTDRWQIYEWHVAGNILSMDSGNAPADTGAFDGDVSPLAVRFHSYQALTPETETSTHYFWAQTHDFEIDKPEVSAAIADQVRMAFAEDKQIIEAQQVVLKNFPDAKMNPIGADAALNKVRWLLNKKLEEERALEKD